jgi:oligopeptidase B
MTAYGSYGASYDPYFDRSVLSLLERGVAFAIVHVRGGQELGRSWYDQGRLLHKRNTFTDFIGATDYLVAQGYAARDRVVARGAARADCSWVRSRTWRQRSTAPSPRTCRSSTW